ncbi:MAG: hypothetical protein UY67_C0004G0002 [Candidatus Kaiserbacteria bacterium GW2011_GWA2_52_12]|uniref:DUF11 domain-containing protein n=1 Tax=Candidatus Kaiserbacteria bacterium GW2011_GWA2_52_12 TaxID=1618671 RepID=A0A0G1ZYA0_9BACT|nr:MAG: hypothetical protein UY67_C0004G0002 [Candidatus Kaiserbacteria bacterium GW2011_GWA2_52_12]
MDPQPPHHEDERIERLRRAMYSRSIADTLRNRERRELTEEKPLVNDDWKRPEQEVKKEIVAPRSMNFLRNIFWWILAGSGLFFLGAVFFFIYYFTFGIGSIPTSPNNIDIAVAGPSQVSGGQPAQLQLVVTNRNKVPLELADLVITYPKGTRSPADFVSDLTTQRITLGTIESGGRRQGTVQAVFAGNEGDKAVIKVELEYHLSGSSAIFAASNDYAITFSSSPLSISVDGKTETTSGQPILLTVTVASNASVPVKDILLSAEYPFGFKVTSADPPVVSSNLWALGDFPPGSKRTITIQGTLKGEQSDERVFHFTAGTRKEPTTQKIDTTLSDYAFHMSINKPFLTLAATINKATNSTVVVSPGEIVTVAINYENNLTSAITNAVIVARLGGVQIDGSAVHSIDGFYRSNDNSMYWDKTTTNGALATLAPGDHGVVGFNFNMPTSDELQGLTSPYIDIAINAAGDRVSEAGVPENLQSTIRAKIALASDLQLVAQGLYYQNPFGSTGPVPPKANVETTYALVFTINNTTNKITGATVKATLPPNVRWVGKYSPPSEKITFNQEDGSLTWNVGDIEPGVGLNGVPPRQAAIAIAFTPSTSQIGQEPPLLQSIKFQGIDSATGGSITRTLPNVTTNLASPAKSSGDIVIGTDQGFSSANSTVVK